MKINRNVNVLLSVASYPVTKYERLYLGDWLLSFRDNNNLNTPTNLRASSERCVWQGGDSETSDVSSLISQLDVGHYIQSVDCLIPDSGMNVKNLCCGGDPQSLGSPRAKKCGVRDQYKFGGALFYRGEVNFEYCTRYCVLQGLQKI